jgi:tetratricopeptide (TPR) repeat protein
MGRKLDRLIPIGIILGALVVRIAFVLQTKDLVLYYHPILDSGFFHQWADFKRQIGWIDASAPFRESLYAYFLALVYTVFRESLTIARLVQCVIGGVSALLVYAIGRKIYGKVAGIAAGIVFAFYGPAVFFASELNETTLALFLLVLSGYMLIKASESRPLLHTGLSGLLLGAAVVARFTMWVAAVAWIIHVLIAGEGRLRKGVITLVIGLAIAPVLNQALLTTGGLGWPVPPRAGWHAFLGSGGIGGTVRGSLHAIPVGGEDSGLAAFAADALIDGQRDALRFARIETTRELGNAGAGRYWYGRAYRDFTSAPGRALSNFFTKLGILMGPSEPPANLDQRFVARYSGLLRTRIFTFVVIVPLGLVGLITVRSRKAVFAGLFIALFAIVSSTFLVSDNEKIILIPFFAVFAGALIATVINTARGPARGKTLAYLVATAVVGVLLYLLPKSPLAEGKQLGALGDVYAEEAIFEKAEESYGKAVEISPDRPEGYTALARLYANAGKPDRALEVLGTALARGIADPRLRIERASILSMVGRQAEATLELEAVKQSYPYEPKLHQLLGLSLMAQGDVEQAALELESEIDLVGGGFVTYSALGSARLALGDWEGAAKDFELAMALNPYNSPVAMQLADAYTRLGYHYKSCDLLSKILVVDPGNMPLRFKFANCLYRAQQYEDALSHFEELHKYDPSNADVMLNMGTVYAAMDSLDRAIEMWEQALVLDPGNELARENLRAARDQ